MSYNAPSSNYQPLMLSHQTGLSATINTANTYQNIGSSFTIPRNGILQITAWGYVNGGNGYLTFNITRGSNTYRLNQALGYSDFTNGIQYITNTSNAILAHINNGHYLEYPLKLPVILNDVIQPVVTNNTAGNIVYITDLLVILQ